MIELILIAQMEMQFQLEADKRRMEREKQWNDEFLAASPEMKTVMLECRRKEREAEEKEKAERVIERRHREQIRAQEKIADAIRSTPFWRF